MVLREQFFRALKDDRFSIKRILSEAQWRLDPMMPAGGFSARQMFSRPNPAGLCDRDARDDDLMFAQDTSVAVQFAQQWNLRMKAQEAALKKDANS